MEAHRDLTVLLARLARARQDNKLQFEQVEEQLFRFRAAQQEFVELELAITAVRADEVKIHGDYVPVLCERLRIDGMSGHADYTEIGDWLDAMSVRPAAVYVTHGDPPAADAFRRYLGDRFGWKPVIPKHGDTVTLC